MAAQQSSLQMAACPVCRHHTTYRHHDRVLETRQARGCLDPRLKLQPAVSVVNSLCTRRGTQPPAKLGKGRCMYPCHGACPGAARHRNNNQNCTIHGQHTESGDNHRAGIALPLNPNNRNLHVSVRCRPATTTPDPPPDLRPVLACQQPGALTQLRSGAGAGLAPITQPAEHSSA